jgi:hypothetical protein
MCLLRKQNRISSFGMWGSEMANLEVECGDPMY